VIVTKKVLPRRTFLRRNRHHDSVPLLDAMAARL
jgi:hypothetical protein